MIINDLLEKFNKDNTISYCDSASSTYDRVIEIASIVFCSDKFDDLEKRELYLEIISLYEQLDKKEQ